MPGPSRLLVISAVTLSSLSLASWVSESLLSGRTWPSCDFGIFFLPSSQFSDLHQPLAWLEAETYLENSEYPPGAVTYFQLLQPLSRVYVPKLLSGGNGGLCGSPPMSVGTLLLLVVGALVLGWTAYSMVFRGSKGKVLGAASVGITFLSLGLLSPVYTQAMALMSLAVLSLLAVLLAVKANAPFWLLGIPVGFAYPILFGWDRGNLDMPVALLLLVAISLEATNLRGGSLFAGVAIGVASALKLWPIVYVGRFFKQRNWHALAAATFSFSLVSGIGLWLLAPKEEVSAVLLPFNSDRIQETNSPHLYYYNRTWSSTLDSALLLTGRFGGPWHVWNDFGQFQFLMAFVGLVIAAYSLAFVQRASVAFTVAALGITFLAPTSATYRSVVFYIALLVVLWEYQEKEGTIKFRQSVMTILLAAAVSPLYFGNMPSTKFADVGATGPPLDTLVGGLVSVGLILAVLSQLKPPGFTRFSSWRQKRKIVEQVNLT